MRLLGLVAVSLLFGAGCGGGAAASDAHAGSGGSAGTPMPVAGSAPTGGAAGAGGGGANAGGGQPGQTAGVGGVSGGAGGTAGTAGVLAGSGGSATGSGGSGGDGGQAGSGASGGVGGRGGAGAGGRGGAGGSAGAGGSPTVPSVLVFSRTAGFRHTSIEPAVTALRALATQRGFNLVATEDSSIFSSSGLQPFNVVMFLLTTGDVLNDAQQAAFEAFIRAGHGFVGVHTATDTEFDWPFYGGLVGAYFVGHPDVQRASIIVEDATHPATRGLSSPWVRTDEWYSFDVNPRSSVTVLLRLDESSYAPGSWAMGSDHPIAWYQEYEGGRAFQTALGHTDQSYSEPAFLNHIAGAITWAAGP
jgi:type 1 glutamine amidotransferase